MMDWLRRRLGESVELAQLREELATARAEIARLSTSIVGHQSTTRDLNNQIGELRALVQIMVEPPVGSECEKVRLRNRDDSERFARVVENQVGAGPGDMEGYKCPVCPRQPLSGEHFWHIRHVDPTQRGKKGAQYRRNRGRGLRTHVDPGVMARLKDTAGGAA